MTSFAVQPAAVWVGSMIYAEPLDPTSAEKFRMMAERERLYVIGQTGRCACKVFFESARFILLPRLPLPGGGFLSIQLFAPFLLLWLIFRDNVDCMIAQSPFEGVPAALAKKTARLFGRKVALVIESHGNFETSLFLSKRIVFKKFHTLVIAVLARFSLRNGDAFRAVSRSTAQQLRDWGVTLPVAEYPAWMALEYFYRASAASARGGDIVFAGDITYLKGIDVLLEAFALIHTRYPQTRLRLAGPAVNPAFAACLRERAAGLHIAQAVDFLGKLSVDALALEMARARAVALPSRSEGMPRVLVESLAAGAPIVCTDTGGMPGIAQGAAYSRLVPVEDAHALAQGLAAFLEPYDDTAMRAVCRQRARECFDAEIYVDTVFAVTATAREHAGIRSEG